MEDLTQGLIEQPETDEQILVQLIEQYRIKASSRFADKEYLLERDGIGFAPRGNVCAIAAEKKAGKSWFGMSLCAAVLSGQYLGMKSRVENARVLYFDTEQDEGDGQRIQRRVHYACGWYFETDNDQFYVFHLREVDAQERHKVVCNLISMMKPDMVIVDGIRDLLKDFNDLEESANVIQDFMRISSEQKCVIWTMLHVNPNSDKMRGHLGTELGNKVAELLMMSIIKNPNDEDDVKYKMEEVAARSHRNIHSVTFFIDDNIPYGMPALLTKEQAKAVEEDVKDDLRKKIEACEFKVNGKSWTELERNLKKAGYGRNERQRMIKDACQYLILKKSDNGRYYLISKNSPQATQSTYYRDDPPF